MSRDEWRARFATYADLITAAVVIAVVAASVVLFVIFGQDP